ncbi:DUF3826 domain-containing protein [Mucilaginibacter sp. NFR10]|uniref:DUF3826 domain-containing protein n=1 Tax=Mucilaginibacter sp. NFR10 TaxID=1566292 RepID=UPI000871A224|nr:DUF3826 domain-containing protein [Mucilaginibacter sp. NFR10]SCW74074.1 Protein of unknown function [Mucilaginibacter sp. NFR10]
MEKLNMAGAMLIALLSLSGTLKAQEQQVTKSAPTPEAKAKADADLEKKATDWVSSLSLNDTVKAARVKNVIATHLKAIRDWNNSHSYESVPAGIDPATGKALSTMDRQIIINSSLPKSVHENLMTGLRSDLAEDQVETILDKYTIGKVAFTLAGYKSIIPDLTPVEEAAILANLKQAREQAVDFKNIKQVSAIFEIYKTKNEQYLNSNGRNWHKLYGDYTKAIIVKKAADKAAKDKAATQK